MDRALYDLAEAACGKNSSMQWSLSDGILRRQVTPVFTRCVEGDLPAEDALDIVMDFVSAGVSHNIEVIDQLFSRLKQRVETRFPEGEFPALLLLEEFVLGLNLDAEWATNDVIARQEMYPMFVRLAIGNMSFNEGVTTFCDHICAKRSYYLELVSQLTQQLTQEILVASQTEREGSTDGNH